MLAGIDAPLVACGHTHFQLLRRVGESLLVNPGSVGLPFLRDGGVMQIAPWAEYAVVTVDRDRLGVDLRRTGYDVDALAETMLESGMPHAEWWTGLWAGRDDRADGLATVLDAEDLVRRAVALGDVERLAHQRPRLAAEDGRELAAAVEVVDEDLDRGGVDVQLVPRRRRAGAQAARPRGARVADQHPVQAPEERHVLVAAEHDVDVEPDELQQQVAGVEDDVPLASGRPGSGRGGGGR